MIFEVLGYGVALGWPLSPQNLRYLVVDRLQLGLMGTIGVDLIAAFVPPRVRVRFVLAGAGGVSLLIGLMSWYLSARIAAC